MGAPKTAGQICRTNASGSWLPPDEEIPEDVGGFNIWLRRYNARAMRKGAALLIHGASASGKTFLIPNGGLVRYLTGAGWDVWTLDWRGSCEVVASLPPDRYLANPEKGEKRGTLGSECSLFTIDKVAEKDIPWAVARIRAALGHERVPIAVVGHCFGSGALAVSLARGRLEDAGVQSVVFSTLGLFYKVTWNGFIKAQDFVIERTLGEVERERKLVRAIDPGKGGAWPSDMAEAYGVWPAAWLPPGSKAWDETFKRLTFMFGQPYLRERLAPGIHGPLLGSLFGGMHLGLYLHAGQMVRRGFADKLDALDVIDRSRLHKVLPGASRAGDLQAGFFLDKRITLLTGAQNQLWHRGSIDLMHDWLHSNWPKGEGKPKPPQKRVFSEAAHQDLLWSTDAAAEAEVGFTKERPPNPGEVYRFIADSIEPMILGRA